MTEKSTYSNASMYHEGSSADTGEQLNPGRFFKNMCTSATKNMFKYTNYMPAMWTRISQKMLCNISKVKKYIYIDICYNCSMNVYPFSNLYGSDFHETLFEFQYTRNDFKKFSASSNSFKDKIFEYQCRESSDILKDIDPDQNDLNTSKLANCKYYFPTELVSITSRQFSIFHLNIRRKNYEKLSILLSTIIQKFDVIVLTETWIYNENVENILIYQIQTNKL